MPRKVPSYRLHKPTGQAVVTLGGKDYYLGKYDSEASHAAYSRKIGEYLAGGGIAPKRPGWDVTITKLVARYVAWAKTYYVKDGAITGQLDRIERSARQLTDLYGTTPAKEFGPLALKAVRQKMIEAGWCRTHINSCVGCLKRIFKWGAGEEMVPASVWDALRAVDGLRAGRTKARESAPVEPVPMDRVKPALAKCLPAVRDMVQVQLLAGMRPGEVVRLRPCDLDRRPRPDSLWVYKPATHKTQHRGKTRLIYFGPQAQKILTPYLDREPAAYCFSPREGRELRVRESRKRKDKSAPVTFGRTRAPGERYTTRSYCRAIARACRKAKVTPWHPGQLRHTRATEIRAQFGPEFAKAVLGHESLDTTRIYAELDMTKAAEVMKKTG